MATHSSVLAWRIPGTGEPGGLLSMGSHRVRHDWSDLAAAVAADSSPEQQALWWQWVRMWAQRHWLKRPNCGWMEPSGCKQGEAAGKSVRCRSRATSDTFLSLTSHIQSAAQFSSVAQSCPTLCDPINQSTLGLPVLHQLLEFPHVHEFTHVHWVGDAIQPSHPLPPSSFAFNLSQHHGLFQWVTSSHQVAKELIDKPQINLCVKAEHLCFFLLGTFECIILI